MKKYIIVRTDWNNGPRTLGCVQDKYCHIIYWDDIKKAQNVCDALNENGIGKYIVEEY